MRTLAWVLVGCLGSASASTLERVRAAKQIVCGVNSEEGDYSRSDDHGAREMFERELCRAVGVAVLGVDAKVVVKAYPDDETAMAGLRKGEVDLLPTLTMDLSHMAGTGLGFSRVVLWDGVGFMVPVSSPVRRAEELAGKKICLLGETEVEDTVRAWFLRKGLAYNGFPYQEEGEMEAGFVTGGCGAVAGDQTRLAMTRIGFGADLGSRFRVLPDVISRDPLGAAYVREADGRFGDVVDWVMAVLVLAEESGVTAASARGAGEGKDVEWDLSLRRLAGRTHNVGARLGLADDWAVRVVGAVGNYGEIFGRDLGVGSAMGLERGSNRLAGDGGLMVGLPLK